MNTKLICYALENTSPAKRTMLHKKLYGYKDFSNHGKYAYQRNGIVQQTKSKRITDAVILVSNQHAAKIIKLFHEYGAKTYVFNVTTTL